MRMSVTQNQRSPGTDIVDIGAPIGVIQVGAIAALEKHGVAAHGPECAHRRVHAPGDIFLRLFKVIVIHHICEINTD